MNASDFACTIFDVAALLPARWGGMAERGPVRTFNPAILRDGDGWIMAYRVVGPDARRRLAVCRLDPSLRVVAGSPAPLSDAIRFAGDRPYPDVVHQWLADPRLYRWGGKLFLYWNSGWHEPQNHQFLQELEPVSLTPTGLPRELRLHGRRQPIEKNWTFFEDADGRLRCIYSVVPHRVLGFSLEGKGDIEFHEIASTAWSPEGYPPSHGGLRGGAPPVWHDGRFWSFCHTVHDGKAGFCYAVAVYCFSHEPGFPPVAAPLRPLSLPGSASRKRSYPRLNPAVDEVLYPCGSARDGTRWLVSHGINDEYCAISAVPDADVHASLAPSPVQRAGLAPSTTAAV